MTESFAITLYPDEALSYTYTPHYIYTSLHTTVSAPPSRSRIDGRTFANKQNADKNDQQNELDCARLHADNALSAREKQTHFPTTQKIGGALLYRCGCCHVPSITLRMQ